MWNAINQEELNALPKLYETESISFADKIIHMHLFINGCDWYIAEYSEEDNIFFGFAILNSDFDMAEWGYVSLDELMEVKTELGIEVDRDLFWKVRPAKEVENITRCKFWQ